MSLRYAKSEVPYIKFCTLLLPFGDLMITCVGTVVFPEYKSNDCSAVRHHLPSHFAAAYFAIKCQNTVYHTVVSPSAPGLAAMYQPFITSCNQPLSNNLVKCVLPISFVPCSTTQGCRSWSFRNSSNETAIFSAIVAIVFSLNTFLFMREYSYLRTCIYSYLRTCIYSYLTRKYKMYLYNQLVMTTFLPRINL